MSSIDLSKYNIDNYPKFDPSTIKPNTSIMVCGEALSGKTTLIIDLVYKLMAHHNIVLHRKPTINISQRDYDYQVKFNDRLKKKYNRLLPICEYYNVNCTLNNIGFYNGTRVAVDSKVDEILEKRKTQEKQAFIFENIDGTSTRGRINALKNLTEKNYFINETHATLGVGIYDSLKHITERLNDYDYIFIFNSYANTFSPLQLEQSVSSIRNVGYNMGLCNEVPIEKALKALISTANISNHICVVIDNTIESHDILDKVFWYKAELNHHLKLKKNCNKIGEWYLEHKYNPKYKFCRDRLVKEYDQLYND